MLIFPDPAVSTEYTDPNGSVWEFNGTGWVRQPESSGGGGSGSGFSHSNIALYEADNFSEANGVVANEGTSHPLLRLSETQWIHLSSDDMGGPNQSFIYIESDGEKITNAVPKAFPNEGTGDAQKGELDAACAKSMPHNAVYDTDTPGNRNIYWLGSKSNEKNMLLQLSDGGATLLCKPDVWAVEDGWTADYALGKNPFANTGTSWQPYLMREDDDTFVALCIGASQTTRQPQIKACVFSASDGSIIEKKYSDLPAHSNPSYDAMPWVGWRRDPRKPDTDAVCLMPWHPSTRTSNDWQLMMFHWAGETRELTTVDLGNCNYTARIRQADNIDAATWFFADDDTMYLEVNGKDVNPAWRTLSFAVALPSDRANLAASVSCHVNMSRSYGNSTTENQSMRRDDFFEKDIPNARFSQQWRNPRRRDSTEKQNHNQSSWPLMQKPDGTGYVVEYADYITSFQCFALPEPPQNSFADAVAGSYLVKPVISGIAPRRTSTHDIDLLSYVPTTGDLVAKLYNRNDARHHYVLVKRTPDSELRLKARVVNGQIVEGPLKGKEAGVKTSGSDWWPVKAEAPSLKWTEKLDDGVLSVDESTRRVIWSRSAVPMSEEELIRAAIDEVESQFSASGMTEDEIMEIVQSQLDEVREALADPDQDPIDDLQRMEYQLKTYLEQSE